MAIFYFQLPNTTTYLLASRDIVSQNIAKVPKDAIRRVEEIGKHIKKAIDPITPKINSDIHKGQNLFREQANNIRSIIDAVITDIHSNTVKSTKTFDDVYGKFGMDRSIVSVIICVLCLVVSTLVILNSIESFI